jgi:hypothetical protein
MGDCSCLISFHSFSVADLLTLFKRKAFKEAYGAPLDYLLR